MSQQSCPYCGNWTFEEEDGILVCTSCGRQQEGGLQIADDEPEFGSLGKVVRKKVEKTKIKVSKVYRGSKAYRLYLLSWQHILWKQCYAMIHGANKAPPELWDLVRDLWGLYLANLTTRLQKPEHQTNDHESSEAENETSEPEESPEGALQRTFQPKLIESVGLLYLGCFLLRLPISLFELYEIIRNEDIPYIRAVRCVPISMSSKLPPEYQEALDTSSIPTPIEVQQAVNKFMRQYCIDHGMTLPALNWRILLFNWIQHLCLPIEVYDAVAKLAPIVGYDFNYRFREDNALLQNKKGQKPRRSPADHPEVQLICLLMIATKALFPHPLLTETAVADTASTLETMPAPDVTDSVTSMITVDWIAWIKVQQSFDSDNDHDEPRSLKPGEHISVKASDIQSLSSEALDEYMEWYQRTFTAPEPVIKEKKSDLEYSILSMFPVPTLSTTLDSIKTTEMAEEKKLTLLSRVCATQNQAVIPKRALKLRSTTNDGNLEQADKNTDPKPQRGLAQTSYLVISDAESLLSTNSFFDNDSSKNPILYLHERAAAVSCLDLKKLLKAIRYTERRLERWATEKRRKEALGE